METEDELDQENQDEEDTESENESQDNQDSKVIRKLRRELRAKDRELREMAALKETNAFLSAGLTDLPEEKKLALKAVVGDDLSVENITAKAKALGFMTDTNTDTDTDAEVGAINQAEKAISQPSSKPDNRDFVTKLNDAKSQSEIMELIRQQGEDHGLLIEDD